MAKEIHIPFKVHDTDTQYSGLEVRKKDAVLLETLQRIANSLEELTDTLQNTKK